MSLDHYITLGRSGLRVSPFCLGAMTFGEDLGWGSSVEESQQIIDRYLELGGNFIDTANFYTKSHSEKIIGDHLGRHPARRDRVVLATKLCMPRPTVTTNVKRLEAAGFLRREIDAEDLRRHRLLLTPSGRKVMNSGVALLSEAFGARLSRLSAAQQAELSHLLEKLG